MSPPLSEWILEHLIRELTPADADEWLLTQAMSFLPALSSPRLQKTLLLRHLASDCSRRFITELTLDPLEHIARLDRLSRPSTHPSDALKRAYQSVAVESTARFLRERAAAAWELSDAVDRIWSVRAGAVERSEDAGLLVGWFEGTKKAMDEEGSSTFFVRTLAEMDTLECALKDLASYLEEAHESLGPPFLKLAAKAIGDDDLLHRTANASDLKVEEQCVADIIDLHGNMDSSQSRGAIDDTDPISTIRNWAKISASSGHKELGRNQHAAEASVQPESASECKAKTYKYACIDKI